MDYKDEQYIKLNNLANEIITTLPGFAGKFFYHIKNQGMSMRTRLQYAYDMQRFFSWLQESAGFKDMDIKNLTAEETIGRLSIEDIQEYADTLEFTSPSSSNPGETHISAASTRARKISSLRSFYKYYFKIGEIEKDLASLIDVPKVEDKIKKPMDREQVARILGTVNDTDGMTDGEIKRHGKIVLRDTAIMMLLLGTGLRVSELVGIDVDDIDFYNASILVTRKGGGEDEVFFGPEVQDALAEYFDEGRPPLLVPEIEDKAFFLSMQHKRLTVRSVQKMIEGYAKKAGLNMKVSPHAMRRSFATNLYEETSDIYLVADALHHSSVETTRRHYAKMSEEHKRTAAKKSSTIFEDMNK